MDGTTWGWFYLIASKPKDLEGEFIPGATPLRSTVVEPVGVSLNECLDLARDIVGKRGGAVLVVDHLYFFFRLCKGEDRLNEVLTMRPVEPRDPQDKAVWILLHDHLFPQQLGPAVDA